MHPSSGLCGLACSPGRPSEVAPWSWSWSWFWFWFCPGGSAVWLWVCSSPSASLRHPIVLHSLTVPSTPRGDVSSLGTAARSAGGWRAAPAGTDGRVVLERLDAQAALALIRGARIGNQCDGPQKCWQSTTGPPARHQAQTPGAGSSRGPTLWTDNQPILPTLQGDFVVDAVAGACRFRVTTSCTRLPVPFCHELNCMGLAMSAWAREPAPECAFVGRTVHHTLSRT